MVRRLFALGALLLLAVPTPRAQLQPPLTPEQWVEAARTHHLGAWDDAARLVARLSAAELRELWKTALEPRFGPGARPFPERDAILIAGATLHADVAMLSSYRAKSPSPGDSFVITSQDGRNTGRQAQDPEWEFGRRLLDAVSADPAAIGVVRSWYHATTAYMAGHGLLADAEPHLAHARESFPRDADLLSDAGWYWEQMASPRIQAVLAELAPPPSSSFRIEYPSAEDALKKAESFFSLALEADPAHFEARLRRGRVRSLRGHHKDALEDLTAALGATSDPEQRYLALLFLGAAHDGLRQPSPARDAYTAASQLFPKAQSPHLALSRLFASRGDMPGAQRALRELLALSPTGANRPDPWWTYPLGRGRYAEELLNKLYEAVETMRGGGS